MAIKAGEGYRVSEGKELEELNRVVNELDDIQRGGIKDLGVIEGAISFGDLEWTNGKAKVTITKITDANYEIEYRVVDKEGSEVQDYVRLASGEKTRELSLGDLVIARLTDGKNYTLDTATLEVTDTAAPTVNASTGTVTTNSIQVTSVSAVDNQAGMPSTINYSYYIKTSSGSYPANANYTGTENSYNFTGLNQKTSYDIKVTAIDIAGNTGVKEIKGITTGTVPDGGDGISTGAITFGSLTWTSQKASVTITKTTSDNLSIEYQVLDKNNQVTRSYQTIASGGTVSNLNLGDFVVARLTDGTNHGNTASIEVTDGTAPTVNASTGTVTTNSIQVTNVSATDGQAGMSASISYSYFIKPSNGSYPAQANHTGTETSYNFTGLTQKTSYDVKITATDIAGNTGIKEIKGITTGTVPDGGDGISTGAITFGSLTWSSQKASVKINKTTSDSLSIEYQVLDKNNQVTRSYQTIASGGTVSNLNLGDFVVARLTDGTNHGNTASIEVTDGTAPSKPTLAVTSGTSGNNGWYRSNVTVSITPGTDAQSGVLKTTYVVTGAGAKSETEGTSVSITADGTSYITAYTYDNAGHKTASSQLTIKKDATNPPTATVTVSSYTGNTVTVSTSMSSTSDTSGIAKYILEYKKNSASTWTTAVEQTTRPSAYKFTGLEANTTYNFRVRTIDNAGNTGTGTTKSQTTDEARDSMNPEITDTSLAGKVVNYTPKSGQTYNVEAIYSGYASDQSWSTADYTGTWSIWGQDADYIYIISTTDTTKTLYLRSHLGYNNGITLLDTLCDTCFTDKTTYPGSTGQNLKLEQVLAVTSSAAGSSTSNYGKLSSPWYIFAFPYVWETYESGQTEALSNRSKAYALTTNGATEKRSANPCITYWYNSSLGTYKDLWKSEAYYTLVRTTSQNRRYWLATRYFVDHGKDGFALGLQSVGREGIAGAGIVTCNTRLTRGE